MAKSQTDSLTAWEKRSDTRILDCRVFHIIRRRLFHPVQKKEADFHIIGSSPWVNILALDAEGKLVMVQQYRYGSEEFSLEPPGGMFEEGESPVEAGLRELQEETGYTGENARIIGQVQPNPAILNNHCYFVLVENARRTESQAWDEHEEIAVITMPWREALQKAIRGEIKHSLAVCALFYLQAALSDNA